MRSTLHRFAYDKGKGRFHSREKERERQTDRQTKGREGGREGGRERERERERGGGGRGGEGGRKVRKIIYLDLIVCYVLVRSLVFEELNVRWKCLQI